MYICCICDGERGVGRLLEESHSSHFACKDLDVKSATYIWKKCKTKMIG